MDDSEAPQTRTATARLPVGLAAGATLLAVGLMAWDHLWGNERGSDDSFPVDAATFFLSLALIVVTGLGFPVVVAGAGIALGNDGAGGEHRRLSALAIGLGVLVIGFAILGTAFPTSDSD